MPERPLLYRRRPSSCIRHHQNVSMPPYDGHWPPVTVAACSSTIYHKKKSISFFHFFILEQETNIVQCGNGNRISISVMLLVITFMLGHIL